ncbi:LAME_0E06766g1_1 [Lachancea meyersii CBS 8951]|uniref:LAME_0E06766g1_1 n=1 Tax=Lachancea meyersii CBS 8951 TaxID=1266667 RepID=A0A1G4JI07_9SACH|nr:LAME_0E06766g1_1 [Lachancea meyersii CBS 8951]
MTEDSISVAFVCLGNICRSPMAEAVFAHTVKQNGLQDRFAKIDSFGTGGWHKGENPDPRSAATCRKHGIPVNHRAQQIKGHHFQEFDYIVCMDEMNLRNLQRMKPSDSKAKLSMFGQWNKDGKYREIVDDPYYGGDGGFEYNFKQIQYFSEQFLEQEL